MKRLRAEQAAQALHVGAWEITKALHVGDMGDYKGSSEQVRSTHAHAKQGSIMG